MSLFICSLNSGSNGNCYYIGNDREAILVDAGISCREIEKRMERLGLRMQKVKAIFVSHEHSDHIKGVCGLVKKWTIPVYITSATYVASGFSFQQDLVRIFNATEPVFVEGLRIAAFPKMHDACDPYSFIVSSENVTIGVFTDIGSPCENLISHFKLCNAAFLEANFDDEMLDRGNYPYHLKKRIRGGKGHLSNKQALAVFQQYKSKHMSHLVLSHLSKNNNCPKLVKHLFTKNAEGVEVIVASRYEESSIYQINPKGIKKSQSKIPLSTAQLSFSFA